jgi:hypothetical protein
MSIYTRVTKAEFYRRYADELSAIAEGLRSSDNRQILLRVADDFYRMANNAESIALSRKLLSTEARVPLTKESHLGPRSD